MWTLRRTAGLAVAVAALISLSRAAVAGPPLICHPFDAGNAPLLPWGEGRGWNTPERTYDVERLAADTLRLLSAEAPVLARMENLRRATIYASRDARVASDLMAAVLARALRAAADRPRDPLAWFDAGYLVESYRQADMMRGHGISAGLHTAALERIVADADGSRFVERALELAGTSPEMEFAASLMKEGAAAAAHRQRAMSGAKPGSLLARNLER